MSPKLKKCSKGEGFESLRWVTPALPVAEGPGSKPCWKAIPHLRAWDGSLFEGPGETCASGEATSSKRQIKPPGQTPVPLAGVPLNRITSSHKASGAPRLSFQTVLRRKSNLFGRIKSGASRRWLRGDDRSPTLLDKGLPKLHMPFLDRLEMGSRA